LSFSAAFMPHNVIHHRTDAQGECDAGFCSQHRLGG
jgi:hypothetical protein